jgi:FMN phosphatase YigB (HAD superfamily)
MNPIIAIDFNGALLKSRPFDEAGRKWFELFSILLGDDSIKDLAFKSSTFESYHDILHSYLRVSDKETQTIFANQSYGMILLAEITSHDLIKEFAEYLRTLKDRYTLALITTAPEVGIIPILNKLHCADIFDITFASAPNHHPDKNSLFIDFMTKYEKPLFYIGLGDKDLGGLKDLDINTISVNWVSRGTFRGDYEAENIDELKQLL